MSKYLDSSLIKPNHWYVDEKGEQFLYCGKASMTDLGWSYPTCYIYLKYSTLLKHYDSLEVIESLSVKELLLQMCSLSFRYFQFSQKPRKFVEDIGKHKGKILHGEVYSEEKTFKFIFE